MDATVARSMWQVFEPIHDLTYFAPEARAATDALGLKGGWMGYFAARAAPLGPVSAEVVIATFYNFHPSLVRRAIPAAWQITTPDAVLAARRSGVGSALRRLLGDAMTSPELVEAAERFRPAAEACDLAGRPLFAANAALPWPDDPLLVLWTATTWLREHRGDGHVASLLAARIDPCEANVTMVGSGRNTAEMQRQFRWWSEDDWQAAAARLRARGLLDADGGLSEAGRAVRESVERTTDELALGPWEWLGTERTVRLWRLLLDLSGRIVDQGGVPIPNPTGLPWPPSVDATP